MNASLAGNRCTTPEWRRRSNGRRPRRGAVAIISLWRAKFCSGGMGPFQSSGFDDCGLIVPRYSKRGAITRTLGSRRRTKVYQERTPRGPQPCLTYPGARQGFWALTLERHYRPGKSPSLHWPGLLDPGGGWGPSFPGLKRVCGEVSGSCSIGDLCHLKTILPAAGVHPITCSRPYLRPILICLATNWSGST